MRRTLAAALALLALGQAAVAGAIDGLTPARLEGRKLRVTTTTNFVTDLARQVGGARVEVSGLMGAGVDPHLYKASAGDVRRLSGADLILYNGLNLEGKMVDLLERLPTAVAVTEQIARDRLRKPDGLSGTYSHDPHVWFDVRLWAQAVEAARDALVKVDPAGADVYRQRAGAYTRRLVKLDTWVRQQIATIPAASRVLITAHDAFGYFGARYGLQVRGLQGMSTVAETGARDVQQLADFIVERKIKAIFVESSVPRRTIEAVQAAARSRGHEVKIGGTLYGDSAGAEGTPEGTYVGMVEANVRTIVGALR